MASLKSLKNILPDYTLEESKNSKKKKKKSKKLKSETLDKSKMRKKGLKQVKDEADCCEFFAFTQMPEKKKRKKKKKNDIKQTEEFALLQTQNKKPNLSKQHKHLKGSSHAVDKSTVQPFPGEQELIKSPLGESSTLKEKTQHKRKVMFNLSPEEILPKSHFCELTEIFQTRLHSSDKLPALNSMFSVDRSHKSPVEENCVESQSTPEDINSQDLFITQKTFSVPYVDISSSLSTDEAIALPPYQNRKQNWSSQGKPSCKKIAEASTQTENFFTSQVLATSLRFHHKSTVSTCFEEPMDLSLPNRSRQELGMRQWHSKIGEDQSHSELKITDVTSSDESDVLSKSKAILPQLKVVQTRLNESFFFKLKGEGESPKPRSPLMVLTGSVDKKSKK